MLLWPAVAFTGFLVLVAVVVALGRMSTNRYEEQRKREGFTRPARSPTQVPGPPARGQQATSTSPAFMAEAQLRAPVRRREEDVARDVVWRNADWMTDTVPIVP
jgi:hypothetical protein